MSLPKDERRGGNRGAQSHQINARVVSISEHLKGRGSGGLMQGEAERRAMIEYISDLERRLGRSGPEDLERLESWSLAALRGLVRARWHQAVVAMEGEGA
jgi:hypothetical protein